LQIGKDKIIMANYVKTTDFAAKDALTTGNPSKIVKGTEIDSELTAIQTAVATKADLASPTFTGTPLTTTAAYSVDNTQIASTAFVHSVIPTGIITMWSGTIATIPLGWALCDGNNDTPDLRDKFIIGATADSSGAKTNVTGSYTQTGGSKDAIVVSHTHTATVTDPGHTHVQRTYNLYNSGGSVPAGANTPPVETTTNYTTQSNTTGITVANSTTGSSGTNANLPPYYALAFIMKTA
jgi:hypothetical protein